MTEIFLYKICSMEDCNHKTGHRMSPTELMNNLNLKKEEFLDAVSTARANDLKHWFVECRRTKTYEPSNLFEIEMYYNGEGSYARSIDVYVIGE